MGPPSIDDPGFFAWRYHLNSPTEHFYSDPWRKSSRRERNGLILCLDSIVETAGSNPDLNIVLTIEAPLWGCKLRNNEACPHGREGDWTYRFSWNANPSYGEYPWYTGSGASAGLMAQVFLQNLSMELKEIKYKGQIFLLEAYISGLKRWKSLTDRHHNTPDWGTIEKPAHNPFFHIVGLNKDDSGHANDAFEGMLLTLDYLNAYQCKSKRNEFDISLFINSVFLTRDEYKNSELLVCTSAEEWPVFDSQTIISYQEDDRVETFPLGVLSENSYFDLQEGIILFTKRSLHEEDASPL